MYLKNITVLLTIIMLAACGSSEKSDPPVVTPPETPVEPAPQKAELIGYVKGVDSLEGVTVTVGEQSTITDVNGFYLFKSIIVPTDMRWLVNFDKADYVSSQKIKMLNKTSETFELSLVLTAPALTKVVDLTQPQTVTLNGDQVSINLPASSVVNGDEQSRMSLTFGDPSTSAGQQLFPGDYQATNDLSQPSDILLESIAFVDISLVDSTGQELTELKEPAQVTLRLPPQYQSDGDNADTYQAGDTIAWWSYHEKNGVWLREDADVSSSEIDDAIVTNVDGVLFASADITHFSWWNLDRPLTEQACVIVKVIDGEPLKSVEINAVGVSYQATTSGKTDQNGYAEIIIKRTMNAAAPTTFKLNTSVGRVVFEYDVTSEIDGDIATDIVTSPTDNAECKTLQTPFEIARKGTVKGIVYGADGAIASGLTLYSSLGEKVTTNDLGQFSFNIPFNKDINIVVPSKFSQYYRVSSDQPTKDIVINLNNKPVVINSLIANPNVTVAAGGSVALSIYIENFDQHVVSWSATKGNITETSATTASWTAPRSGSGSAEIVADVTSKDQRHASKSIMVEWGIPMPPTEFIFNIKNEIFINRDQNKSLAGIEVILHASNGIDIEKSVMTDEEGEANLGVIDRLTASFTVIESFVLGNDTEETHHITSIVDIPTRRFIPFVHMLTGYTPTEQEETPNCGPGDERILYDAKFTNIPTGIKQISVANHENSIYTVAAGVTDSGVVEMSFCRSYFRSKKSGMYIFAKGYDAAGTVIAHSTLVVSIGVIIDELMIFNMIKQPTEIMVTVEGLSDAKILGRPTYTGVDVFTQSPVFITSNSGQLFAYDFGDTLNTYQAYSEGDAGVEYLSHYFFGTNPEAFTIKKPVFSLGENTFDQATGRYNWQVTKAEFTDALTIVVKSDHIRWTVITAATKGSWVLPTIPSSINQVLQSETQVLDSVELRDVTDFDGFADYSLFSFTDSGIYDYQRVLYDSF